MSAADVWSMLGQVIGRGLNSNGSGMVAGRKQSGYSYETPQPQGMQMQSAPQMDRGASDAITPGSILQTMDPINSKMNSATMQGIQTEKDLYAPMGSAPGGYMAQSVNPDSGKPVYNSSKMQDYLNYMRYRQ